MFVNNKMNILIKIKNFFLILWGENLIVNPLSYESNPCELGELLHAQWWKSRNSGKQQTFIKIGFTCAVKVRLWSCFWVAKYHSETPTSLIFSLCDHIPTLKMYVMHLHCHVIIQAEKSPYILCICKPTKENYVY